MAVRYGVCPVPLALPICVLAHRQLLSTSVETSLFFPVIEEAVMTLMLKDEPGPPTPPSLYSTERILPKLLSSSAARAALGWLEAGGDGSPSQLSRLPPDIKLSSLPLFQPADGL